MAVQITLIEFLQLSGYRGNFEDNFSLTLCFNTVDGDEEFVDKPCNTFNIIEYQDWKVTSFDKNEHGILIFIKKP